MNEEEEEEVWDREIMYGKKFFWRGRKTLKSVLSFVKSERETETKSFIRKQCLYCSPLR